MALVVKYPPADARDAREIRFNPKAERFLEQVAAHSNIHCLEDYMDRETGKLYSLWRKEYDPTGHTHRTSCPVR